MRLSTLSNPIFEGVRSVVGMFGDAKDKLTSFKNRIDVLVLSPSMLAAELQNIIRLNMGINLNSTLTTTVSATLGQLYPVSHH